MADQVESKVAGLSLSTQDRQHVRIRIKQIVEAKDAEVERIIRENLMAKERILVAELQQGDAYTKKARPTVVYFGLLLIALNYFLLPLLLLISGNFDIMQNCQEMPAESGQVQKVCERTELFPLPSEFWMAWGGIVATWAVGRSFEKVGAGNKVSRVITGSQKISLLDDEHVVG